MLSVLWFSLFAALSGFSTSYAMLFALRALFGLGMGGEWAAGMPLVLEHWPTKLRGLVSGLLLGGWYWGYLLAAAAFQFVYPLFANGTIPTSPGAPCSGCAWCRRSSRCGFAATCPRARCGWNGSASWQGGAPAARAGDLAATHLPAGPDRHHPSAPRW